MTDNEKQEILHKSMFILRNELARTLPEGQTVSPQMYTHFNSRIITPTFYVMEKTEKGVKKLYTLELNIR